MTCCGSGAKHFGPDPGARLVNLDLRGRAHDHGRAGKAIMGMVSHRANRRAVVAAQRAIESPLLEASVHGAQGV